MRDSTQFDSTRLLLLYFSCSHEKDENRDWSPDAKGV